MATAQGRSMGTRGSRTPAQMFALVFGAVYLLIGLLGFAATGFDNFAKDGNDTLILFEVNPLHNIVHIAVGALWVGSAAKHATAKAVNTLIGVVYILLGAIGVVSGALEFLSINDGGEADNFLHIISGAASLFFGTVGASGPADRPATTA